MQILSYMFSLQFLLNWATMTLSLFNTILLLWLGSTVLLNAERRTWGVWLASGGLLLGTAFFFSHSAILGYGLHNMGWGINFWWHVGWIPVITLPFVWYILMLWYAGYWETQPSSLQRRQRPWLYATSLLVAGLVGLLAFANALPSYWQVVQRDLSATPALGGVPLVLLLYPFYVLLCTALSLDTLRRPGPSRRVMGDLARQRARPWLIAASVALLLVGLLVALVMLWIVANFRQQTLYDAYGSLSLAVMQFDLSISFLIATAILFLGQAIVSYEVFAGKTLPRRGIIRHWHRAVILAAGYGLLVGWGLTLQLRPIYALLLTTVLMTLFYALLSWRSYAERERFFTHLRPFVASQRLYEHLLSPSESKASDLNASDLFQALCEDILGARLTYLLPLGPLTPLVNSPLTYPLGLSSPSSQLTEIVAQIRSAQTRCIPLDPTCCQGAVWAVPLWSGQQLVGVLLLGEKQDGGLYTQEEIEIAQASGERLVDTLASTEMARWLMALQRQRLAESQVLDQRARRVLHDDVLPLLHTAMLSLSQAQTTSDPQSADAITLLADAHRQIASLLQELATTTTPEVARLGLIGALRQVADDELKDAFHDVAWQIEPEAEQEAQALPPLTSEVVFFAAREAMRNAARHGCVGDACRPLHLRLQVASHAPSTELQHGQLEILVEDDGVGLDAGHVSSERSGQGLALHSTMMAVVGGTLEISSLPGKHTRVLLTLPLHFTPTD